MNYSDKARVFWYLHKIYSDNIMFDVILSDNSDLILPIVLLKHSAYIPFNYKGLIILSRHPNRNVFTR